jgi:hypothetical protein
MIGIMRRAPFRLALILAAMLAACGERPPRPDPEGGHVYNSEPGTSAMDKRTLEQGEL